MARLLLLAVVAVIVDVFALIDLGYVSRTRAFPKATWALVIVLVPIVGALLWFLVGRVSGSAAPPPRGPDDDPDFLRRMGGR